MSKKLLQSLVPLEIGAKAMEIKVSFARDVVVESDSKLVADTLQSLCTPPVVVSNILSGVAYKL